MTNDTLRSVLKDYLTKGELSDTTSTLEKTLNEVLVEIEAENKKKMETVQKARELDTIAELIKEYLNKYYPCDSDDYNDAIAELISRDFLDLVFETLGKLLKALAEEDVTGLLTCLADIESKAKSLNETKSVKPTKTCEVQAATNPATTTNRIDELESFINSFQSGTDLDDAISVFCNNLDKGNKKSSFTRLSCF